LFWNSGSAILNALTWIMLYLLEEIIITRTARMQTTVILDTVFILIIDSSRSIIKRFYWLSLRASMDDELCNYTKYA
jgi:hypothetical protein